MGIEEEEEKMKEKGGGEKTVERCGEKERRMVRRNGIGEVMEERGVVGKKG